MTPVGGGGLRVLEGSCFIIKGNIGCYRDVTRACIRKTVRDRCSHCDVS